jgi:hypothetical protein
MAPALVGFLFEPYPGKQLGIKEVYVKERVYGMES